MATDLATIAHHAAAAIACFVYAAIFLAAIAASATHPNDR